MPKKSTSSSPAAARPALPVTLAGLQWSPGTLAQAKGRAKPPLEPYHQAILDTYGRTEDAADSMIHFPVPPRADHKALVAEVRRTIRAHGHKHRIAYRSTQNGLAMWAEDSRPRKPRAVSA